MKPSVGVVLRNVTASWEDKMETLVDISLTAEERNLIGVVGPVGAGKVSLTISIVYFQNVTPYPVGNGREELVFMRLLKLKYFPLSCKMRS